MYTGSFPVHVFGSFKQSEKRMVFIKGQDIKKEVRKSIQMCRITEINRLNNCM